jgi:hypothetical protein
VTYLTSGPGTWRRRSNNSRWTRPGGRTLQWATLITHGRPRQQVDVLVASMAMTTLDDRLYAWLSEADDRRFTLAFNSYFLVAYPAVVRYLARFAPSDPALLEEVAQDSLLRFFERIGRGRRTASEAVADALRQIKPISADPFHERPVRAWTADVESYRRAMMGFRLPHAESGASASWKNTIHELTLRIPTLQRQGWQLIDGVRN